MSYTELEAACAPKENQNFIELSISGNLPAQLLAITGVHFDHIHLTLEEFWFQARFYY